MRQSIIYAMAIAAICLTTACQNKLQPEAPEQVARTFKVHASQDGTRTGFYGEVGSSASYTWEQGDRLKLFELSDGDSYLEAVSDPLPQPNRNVTFSVTFNEDPLGNNLKYVGVYLPGVSNDGYIYATDDEWFDEWGPVPSNLPWIIHSKIPWEQSPTATCFDSKADLLFSRMVDYNTNRPGEIDLAFARVGSVAKITLTNLPAGEEVVRVNLSHGDSWDSSGDVYYEPESEKVAYRPFSIKSGDGSTVRYICAEPTNLIVGSNGTAVIWLRVLSGTLSDYFCVEVTTRNGKEYSTYEKNVDLTSFTPARTIRFDEGDITAFSVSMEQPPVILPFTFSQETLTLFPELDSDHPQIRIPRDYYMYKDGDLKVSFASVPNNSCYVSLAMDEEWLGLYWDNDEEGNYYLYKKSSYLGTTDTHRATLYIYWDNAEYKIPIIEDEDYYANLGLPLSLDLMIGEQVVTNQNVTVVSGTEVTFKASFGTFPSWLGDYSIMSRWVAVNQSQTDNGYVPSPNLPIINPESYYNSPEIAITPGQIGNDVLGFEYYVIPSNPTEWLDYIYNYAVCYVTVSPGAAFDDRFGGQPGTPGGANPDGPDIFNGGSYDL